MGQNETTPRDTWVDEEEKREMKRRGIRLDTERPPAKQPSEELTPEEVRKQREQAALEDERAGG